MAKRMRSTKRGTHIQSSNRPDRLLSSSFIRLRPVDLSVFEDRRMFHPDPLPRAISVRRKADADVVVKKVVPFRRLPHQLSFRVPDYVAMCIRRKVRREVIHALRLEKRGAGGAKRRNEFSNVEC